MLPKNYQWLLTLKDCPLLVVEFLKIFGTKETPGKPSNPIILGWAKVCGLAKQYINDGIAWCGLMIAYLCHQTGKDVPINPLWALNWRWWGIEVAKGDEATGDLYIKERRNTKGELIGGHVAIIIAEDATHFHVAGGNQGDTACIARVDKTIKYWCRRPAYINRPKGAVKHIVNPDGITLKKVA